MPIHLIERSYVMVNKSLMLLASLCVVVLVFFLAGKGGNASAPVVDTDAADKQAKKSNLNELEKKFQETLSNATLVGKWRLVKDGKLGEEREEKYTLGKVSKLGSLWIIRARIQFGKKDVTLPVPVRVEWAGDTPVISVTDAGLPGLGKYTARVLVYNGLYTGTWFGSDHGGFLTGKIVRASETGDKAAETKP